MGFRTRWILAILLAAILIKCRDAPRIEPAVAVGAEGGLYLAAEPYSSLLIEIQAMSGAEPDVASIKKLIEFTDTHLNKPMGTTYVIENIPALGQSSYSSNDIVAIEGMRRKSYSGGTRAVVYFLFLDGPYDLDTSKGETLGVAFGPSSVAVFEKSILSSSGFLGLGSRVTVETTVLRHEFGHLLGLVNTGATMQTSHEDTANRHHCSDHGCLMHFTVDRSDFWSVLMSFVGGRVPTLDANCIADLRARGGK